MAPHIKISKAKTSRALNILKTLAHHSKGCIRKVLLLLYQALIRLILNYASSIYEQSPRFYVKFLEPIQNSVLRFAIGAFRTSPAISLGAEA